MKGRTANRDQLRNVDEAQYLLCEKPSGDSWDAFELKNASSRTEFSELEDVSEPTGIGHNAGEPVVILAGIYRASLYPGHQIWRISRRCPVTRKAVNLQGYFIGSRVPQSRVREHIEILNELSKRRYLPKMEGDA